METIEVIDDLIERLEIIKSIIKAQDELIETQNKRIKDQEEIIEKAIKLVEALD